MLSNHFHNGIETAKLAWSRLPTAVEEEAARTIDASVAAESLDYVVIENHAYRQDQAERGKLFLWYHVMVKWLFSLIVGIGLLLWSALPLLCI